MNAIWSRAASAGALYLALVGATAAGAQGPAGPGGPPSNPRGDQLRPMVERMHQRREQRLHDILQIRPDQDGAFRAYVAALTPPPGDRDARRGPGAPDVQPRTPMTTPERLDRMAARMAERQQRFQQIAAATRVFYAALSADQRRAFDDLSGEGLYGRRGGGWARGGGR